MDEPESRFAIHEAAREGRTQIVESLLNANPKLALRIDDDGRLPLHWACAYNHLEIVNLLISASPSRSFDPDATDSSGWTALMMASSLRDNTGETLVQLLLSKDAQPKLQTNTGATALHFAASKGNLEICRMLLDAGASARIKDRRGHLALHRAASVGSLPIVKMLVDRGKSPVNASDIDGLTALHHAVSEGHGDVAVELLKKGADPTKIDGDGRLAINCAPDVMLRRYILQAAEAEGIELEK